MAGLGNPLGFTLGGGPSAQEAAYQALRSAVGTGNATPVTEPRESLMEAWRLAKARGIAAATEDARAMAQYFPAGATDMIPMYEQLLRVSFPVETSDQERRDELERLWTRYLDSAIPTVDELLTELDPSITILIPDHDLLRETQAGRMFQDWDPTAANASGPAFGLIGGSAGPNATGFPNYSDDFIFMIRYPLTAAPTEAQQVIISKIGTVMNEVMPSWCDYRVFSVGSGVDGDTIGFILDTDLLDLTVFGT